MWWAILPTANAAQTDSAARASIEARVMTSSAIILFAHGARDPQWAEPFQKIRAMMAQQLPDTPIELAFLELMQPQLSDSVKKLSASGATQITLIPLFMAQGGHLKHDLPLMLDDIRRENPTSTIHVTPPIGESPELLALIAEWACKQHQDKK
jgi:sirohydrochlorin cobaltochelatase